MQLRPLVCALNIKVLLLKLEMLRAFLVFIERIRAVAVGNAGLAYALVAY